MQMLFYLLICSRVFHIHGINVDHQGCPRDYLKIWRCSWVSLRSSLTASEFALGSAVAQIMSDYAQAAGLWLAVTEWRLMDGEGLV